MIQKPLLLIVEDDQTIRLIFKSALEQNYRCRLAEEGLQAVEYARAKSPDLILMDIEMPRLNRWEGIGEIRSTGEATPIVVMSEFSHSWNHTEAVELKVTDYLEKPFCLYRLREKMLSNIVPEA